MRYLKAIFKNWIGFNLGLGLDTLEIDFTKCTHRICLIMGANGSGKTTLLEGLTLFTDIYSSVRGDTSDFIITDENGDRDGYRELWVEHNSDVYISRVFWTKKGTKCSFIRINKDGSEEELNPNGNVRSYEELLFVLFGLTKDHDKFLFLGPGMRDIITMTPSERKNNINKFTPNTDKYLALYKDTTKYYSKLKNDISVITNEIHRIGDDRNKISSNRDNALQRYNLTLEKQERFKSIYQNCTNVVRDLSINGESVLSLHDKLVVVNNNFVTNLNYSNSEFINLCNKYQISTGLPHSAYKDMYEQAREELTKYSYHIGEFANKERMIRESKVAIDMSIRSKENSLNDYKNNNDPKKFIEEQRTLNDELTNILENMESIKKEVRVLPKDNNDISFTTDDATKYLYFVDRIVTDIQNIQLKYSDNNILAKYLDDTLSKSNNSESEFESLNNELRETEENISKIQNFISECNESMKWADMLEDNSIKDCPDTCPFIHRAINSKKYMENKRKIQENLSNEITKKNTIERKLNELDKNIDDTMNFFKDIHVLSSYINSYSQLFTKFPDYQYMSDMKELFRNIVLLLPRARKYSEFSYLKDRYDKICNRLLEIKDYIDKSVLYYKRLETEENELMLLKKQASDCIVSLEHLNNEKQKYQYLFGDLQERVTSFEKIIRYREYIVNNLKKYYSNRENLNNLSKRYYVCKKFNEKLELLNQKINENKVLLNTLETEYHNEEYNLRRYDEYVTTKETLEKEFELLDTLRKCWSATTGIPLIFIEKFMNTLLANANKYLKEIWYDKEFKIKGFNIDEKNFYILIDRGDGELTCRDASLCSSAERAMLCTVISLALMKQMPNIDGMFNITKFDEIDGVLDYDKRRIFISILNDLLDDINSEQSFVISHSDTFQSDVDVILLSGSDEYESRLLNGGCNVIYKY